MNKTYLLLGSNLDNPRKKLATAQEYIQRKIGSILRQSSIYQTAAWGNTQQPDFLNQVIIVDNKLDPHQTMQTSLDIEKKMGRIRTEKNAARLIDIDILFYDKLILDETSLTIPHPFIAQRRFVLVPLNELSPRFIHPGLKKNIHELLLHCPDKLDVKKI
jgi:2-amino-4-hydroxy-6-hydroxymethyldihydropteridine diphosphokinase